MFFFLTLFIIYSNESIADLDSKLDKAKADLKKFDDLFETAPPDFKIKFNKLREEIEKNPKKYINKVYQIKKEQIKNATSEEEKINLKKELEHIISTVKSININNISESGKESFMENKKRNFNPKKELFDPLMDNDIFALISSSYKNRTDSNMFQTE